MPEVKAKPIQPYGERKFAFVNEAGIEVRITVRSGDELMSVWVQRSDDELVDVHVEKKPPTREQLDRVAAALHEKEG